MTSRTAPISTSPLFVHEWFDRTAEAVGSMTAIEYGETRLNYRALNERSSAIAEALLRSGIENEALVWIFGADRLMIVVAMIGILKSGSAFVTVTPDLPDGRILAMLKAAPPVVVIAEDSFLERVQRLLDEADIAASTLVFEKVRRDRGSYLAVRRDPDSLSYIFFTSGSAGKPKPIAGRLRAIDHFINWEIQTLDIEPGIRVSQLIHPCFDAFLRDIFVPLCVGGTVCIPPSNDLVSDERRLASWIRQENINLVHCTPSLFRFLLGGIDGGPKPSGLRYALLSGETLTPEDVRSSVSILGAGVQLCNLYGPSETTMTKFFYRVSTSDADLRWIPIGRPIKGAQAILIDEEGKVCPNGTVGEIYIRTPYRSLGYYNEPERTVQTFVPNPVTGDPKDIVYRTGDLGRIREDGEFQLLGRRDRQVKVRGVRIELDEVESILRSVDCVRDIAVIDNDGANGKQLFAYVVLEPGGSVSTVQNYALNYLPEYMTPGLYITLESLPLTANGKLDRKALPQWGEEERREGAAGYVGPRTEVEEILAGIWADVLGVERVGVHDNFFELGGHSLLATQVVSRIRDILPVEFRCGLFVSADGSRFGRDGGEGFEGRDGAGSAAHRAGVARRRAGTVVCPAAVVVHRSVGAWQYRV